MNDETKVAETSAAIEDKFTRVLSQMRNYWGEAFPEKRGRGQSAYAAVAALNRGEPLPEDELTRAFRRDVLEPIWRGKFTGEELEAKAEDELPGDRALAPEIRICCAYARQGLEAQKAGDLARALQYVEKCQYWAGVVVGTWSALEQQEDVQPEQVAANLQAVPHGKRQRGDLLTPLVAVVMTETDNPARAFVIMRGWAQETPPRPPLIGVSEDGIKWLDSNDKPQFLNLDALRDRIRRVRDNTR